MNNGRIAVPSNGKGGLSGVRSDHFGHCDVFTVIDVKNKTVNGVTVLKNEDHGQGGCLVPVSLLDNNGVNAVIVAGIGRRPLSGFNNAGIEVYTDTIHTDVKSVVEKLIDDQLQKILLDEACSGGGNCH